MGYTSNVTIVANKVVFDMLKPFLEENKPIVYCHTVEKPCVDAFSRLMARPTEVLYELKWLSCNWYSSYDYVEQIMKVLETLLNTKDTDLLDSVYFTYLRVGEDATDVEYYTQGLSRGVVPATTLVMPLSEKISKLDI